MNKSGNSTLIKLSAFMLVEFSRLSEGRKAWKMCMFERGLVTDGNVIGILIKNV